MYGTAALQQQYQGETLSLQHLQQEVQSFDAAQGRHLCNHLDEVVSRHDSQPLEVLDTTVQVADKQQLQRSQVARGVKKGCWHSSAGVLALKPSGVWRAGDTSGYASPRRPYPVSRAQDNQGATNPVYPEWWLTTASACEQAQGQRQSGSQRQAHLVHSDVQQPQHQIRPTYSHLSDNVLGACVSYDGQQRTASLAARQGLPTTVCSNSQEGRCAAPPAAAGKFVKHPAVRHVESEVKQAIAASKQQAARHMQQGDQLLAVAAFGAVVDGSGDELADDGSGHVFNDVSCPPADAAHQLLSSSWSSWFVSDRLPELSTSSLPLHTDLRMVNQQFPQQQNSSASRNGNSSSNSRSTTAILDAEALPPNAACEAQTVTGLVASLLHDATLSVVLKQLPSDYDPATSLTPLLETSMDSTAPTFPSTELHQGHGLQLHHKQLERLSTNEHALADIEMSTKRAAWAFDYGHLDAVELNVAAQTATTAARGRRQAAGKQWQLWSEKWVGNFGHLQASRIGMQQQQDNRMSHSAFSPASDDVTDPRFMSPDQLQQLVNATARLLAP